MLELQKMQHRRIVMLGFSALVFAYYAIWQLFSSFHKGGGLANWRELGGQIYLLACSVLLACAVVAILIRSFYDHRAIVRAQNHDSATGMPNRNFLMSALAKMPRDTGQGPGLLIIELTGLKSIATSMGKEIGNDVLREIGARLSALAAANVSVVRLRENQFGALLHPPTDRAALEKLAMQILELGKRPVTSHGSKNFVDFSIGAAFCDEPNSDIEDFVRCADMALLHAKTSKLASFVAYSDEMQNSVNRLSKLETGLREALAANQIDIFYQPLFAIQPALRIVGVEALARWKHPELGPIAPNEFVAVAEAIGLTPKLGKLVLIQACRQIETEHPLKLAVNISPSHFIHPDFVDDVEGALSLSGLDPARLEIEITENVLISMPDRAIAIIDALRQRGVSVALDDFGTGYSGLSYLSQYDVDRVKIDASFVRNVESSESARHLFEAIVRLIGLRGFAITVEGIETEQQFEFVRTFRNHWYQGFYFSKPMSYPDLLRSEFLAPAQVAPRNAAASSGALPAKLSVVAR